MHADIITIGDELLIGQVDDTNGSWIAGELNMLGIEVNRILSIGDDHAQIVQTLERSCGYSDLVIITGGLGPTKDDITKNAFAEFLNTSLVLDNNVLDNVKRIIHSKGGQMNDLNKGQALIPEASTVIQNPIGTAPVLWMEKCNTAFISFPGVPFEMKELMQRKILPEIKRYFKTPAIVHRTVLTTGFPEAHLAEYLEEWEKQLPEYIHLSYLPSPGRIRLRLTGVGKVEEELQKAIDKQIEQLKTYIPKAIYGFDNDSLESVVGKLLSERNATLSTAESCTGGRIAYLITSVSGASEYFTGSAVAYSNAIKEKLLNVSKNTLYTYGAVSPSTVEEMARGAKNYFGTDYSVAVSGIAGPSGGTPDKPVGTVWVGVGAPDHVTSKKFFFNDNRDRNIIRFTSAALNFLRMQILGYEY